MVTDYNRIINMKCKDAKCFCGKTERLIPYCGYYICVWCRTGQKRVSRSVIGLALRLVK